MADNHLTFRIGSAFSGEGFTKAQQAVKKVNGEIRNASGAASQIAAAFGQMDATASKSLQALTGVIGALATFNVTAIATQGMMMAINAYFDSMKEKAEAAKASADALKISMEKAFAGALSGRMAEINNQVKSISSEFESVTKQANAFAAALEGVRAAEANGGIAQLQIEKLNAMLDAHSEAERANIEASYNLKIAIEKSANAESEWQSKINAATDARTDNAKRIASIEQQLAVIEENRRQLEETMMTAKESGDSHYLEIQKKLNDLKNQEAALEQKKLDAEDQNLILDLKLKEVKQQAANAQAQATVEIRQAELAEKKLTEAKHNREVKESAAADAAALKEASDRDAAKQVKSFAEVQAEANKAAQDLAAAEREYAQKLAAYNQSDIISEAARNEGRGQGRGLLPVDVQRSIATTVVDQKVDDAIRNGAIKTVKEADRLQRQEMRNVRDRITKEQRQQLAEAKKYKRLQEMNPKALASSDKAFMAKYEKIVAAAEQRKKEMADAKKAVDDAKKKREETVKELQEINKALKKLGLK